jgi:hypothetical protein
MAKLILVAHDHATYSMKSTLICILTTFTYVYASQSAFHRVCYMVRCCKCIGLAYKVALDLGKTLMCSLIQASPVLGGLLTARISATSSIQSKLKKRTYLGIFTRWVISSELSPFSNFHTWFIAQRSNMFMHIYIYIYMYFSNVYIW